jgi:Fuc2NAc and GlcNAc transferase
VNTVLLQLLVPAIAAGGAWLLTALVIRRAGSMRLIDLPNARSSHSRPTPRGGGLSIVIVVLVMLLWQAVAGGLGPDVPAPRLAPLVLALGGAAMAIVGFIDDLRGLSARLRFGLQGMAALGTVLVLGGVPDEVAAALPALAGAAGIALCVVVVLWFLNLFNFMDGIDGIAAAQCIFMSGAGALLGARSGADPRVVLLMTTMAAAAAGFLAWNRAPARIFMGDVGSAFLGYLLPCSALWLSTGSGAGVWTFIVLGTLFIGDASATLARRSLRRRPWSEAHRSHVYQQLARRSGSHGRVTAGYSLVNLLLVLPIAGATVRWADQSAAIAVATTLVSIGAFWLAGAGREHDR